jgi:hypothetical protein
VGAWLKRNRLFPQNSVLEKFKNRLNKPVEDDQQTLRKGVNMNALLCNRKKRSSQKKHASSQKLAFCEKSENQNHQKQTKTTQDQLRSG